MERAFLFFSAFHSLSWAFLDAVQAECAHLAIYFAHAETPLNDDQVWLNTKSGKYCKPGSRYYTKTKQGEYLSEKEAVQKGYLPANGTGE